MLYISSKLKVRKLENISVGVILKRMSFFSKSFFKSGCFLHLYFFKLSFVVFCSVDDKLLGCDYLQNRLNNEEQFNNMYKDMLNPDKIIAFTGGIKHDFDVTLYRCILRNLLPRAAGCVVQDCVKGKTPLDKPFYNENYSYFDLMLIPCFLVIVFIMAALFAVCKAGRCKRLKRKDNDATEEDLNPLPKYIQKVENIYESVNIPIITAPLTQKTLNLLFE
jgi:hypothetical protein